MLVYLFKDTTITDMFLCWKIDLLCDFIKNMVHDFVKDMFKTTMQSLKV